jgi:hypothetical protein
VNPSEKLKSFQVIFDFDRGVKKFPDRKVELLFKPPTRGSWLDRFTIYGTGYSVRSKEAMHEMYELLPKLMGEKKWDRLGHRYVSLYPSRSTNLSDLGNRFSYFLKKEGYKKWADVADFEFLISKSFHAFREMNSFGLQAAAEITEHSKFIFQSSTFLFDSNFRIVEAWHNRARNPKLKRGKSFNLIYRIGDVVCADEIDQKQFNALEKLKRGLRLGVVIRDLKNPLKLSQWLKFWIETEIISSASSR